MLRESKRQLGAQRPDVQIVGDELHPMGRVKDFAPYASKILASGAQAVITGNWGNDLTLLVKAAREAGFDGSFYTFYGNALGAPAAIGDAGIGRVRRGGRLAAERADARSPRRFYRAFRERFPKPADDYVHMRMQLMVEALAQAIERAGSADAVAVARALEKADVTPGGPARPHARRRPPVPAAAGGGRDGPAGHARREVRRRRLRLRLPRGARPSLPSAAEMPTSCKMQRP